MSEFIKLPNQRFRFMQVVKQSEKAKKCFIHNDGFAIVLGWSRNGQCIYVRRIGFRGKNSYHYSFWEECGKEEVNEAAKMNSDMMLKQ
jgi:hypothetical protein